ncbi:conserved protein of unknown function [Latilactobacillus sakei]|nr:conserved protein of unknown function [Latilactobacillus sakei]
MTLSINLIWRISDAIADLTNVVKRKSQFRKATLKKELLLKRVDSEH